MTYELTIKFNSALLLNNTLPGIEYFSMPDDYYKEATRYHTLADQPVVPLNVNDPQTPFEKALAKAWINFIEWLKNRPFLKPRYLFSYNPASLPNLLWGKMPDIGRIFIPNFYNYFTMPLPDGYSLKQMAELIDDIEPFLPYKTQDSDPPLLEYAYLKSDPQPLSPDQLTNIVRNGGNQHYLNKQNLPTDGGKGVTLTIVEADGWYIDHTQFKGTTSIPAAPTPALLFPKVPKALRLSASPRQSNFTLLKPADMPVLAEHGTKILGVLIARSGDKDKKGVDLCRGIVPHAQIKLASCLVELELTTATRQPQIQRKYYNEPDTVLAAVADSGPGDVILIEVGSGTQSFPLEIQPAIFELLQVAYQQHVIVVEAAGNQFAYVGGTPHESTNRLSLRNAVSSELIDDADSERNRTYWIAYTDLLNQIQSLSLDPNSLTIYNSPEDFANHYVESLSGAILVGATDGTLTKLGSSSWGERVQVFAQGIKILTTATANQFDVTQETSGAAAIIAGFVVALQGLARQTGKYITPAQMTTLLQQGKPVTYGGITGHIPDFKTARTILSTLQLLPLPTP